MRGTLGLETTLSKWLEESTLNKWGGTIRSDADSSDPRCTILSFRKLLV